MKLVECYIENFGKLHDFKYSFSTGLNSIKKENGYGKTTLSVFIKAMLYGLDDTRRVKLEENDRKHYMPWQGGRCGGSLTFEKSGVVYRIERSFAQKAADDTFKLYFADTGAECNDYSEKLGEELFMIDSDGFERTIFLSEANLSGKNDNKTVSAKLSDLSGTEGDLSVMDEAISLLEKQRKIYYKKGGAGEIEDTRTKIRNIDLEINDILRVKEKCEEEETKLRECADELRLLKEKRRLLADEEKKASERKLKRTYENQYLDMLKSLEDEKERKRALSAFFATGLPTNEEIERASEADRESKRIKEAQNAKGIASEYTELAQFFSSPLDEGELSRAEMALVKIDAATEAALRIRRDMPSCEVDYLSENLPDAEQIKNHIEAIENARKSRFTAKQGVCLATSLAIILLGGILGYFIDAMLYTVCGVGFIMAVLGLILLSGSAKKKANADAKEFLGAFSKEAISGGDIYTMLLKLKMEYERTEERRAAYVRTQGELDALERETAEESAWLSEFIGRFPIPSHYSFAESVKAIRRKHELFKIIAKNESQRVNEMQSALIKARALREEADLFRSRFPTVSESPFAEIREKLLEYSASVKAIERMQNGILMFIKEHGIDPDHISKDRDVTEEETENPFILDEKISDCEKKRAFLENKCRIAGEFIEKLDELYAERATLAEKEVEYTKTLDTIKKTQKYLAQAKDLITSRYLAKTKAAFDKYITLIGSESAEEFKMDTTFMLMKSEHGALRSEEAYSRGTRDLYALATRLALIDSLYESEEPFIILDDPFAYFDDKRLAGAMSIIKKLAKEKQIIYFTCTAARSV